MGIKRRRNSSYCTVCVLVTALSLWTGVMSAAHANDPHARNAVKFCDSPVRDYEAPLRSLPPLEELSGSRQSRFVPVSRQPPFAPSGVEVADLGISPQRLAFVGTAPGYRITNTDTHSTVSLKWIVKVGVSRVVAGGSSLVPLSESAETVDLIAPGGAIVVQAGSTDALGLYRVDISFSNDAGQTLGAYAEYLRVVPSKLEVRLGLSQRQVRPGRTIKSRIENVGTREVSYGHSQILERFEGGGWVELPQHPVFSTLSVARAGMAGECLPVHVPAHAQPGRYRIRQRVEPLLPRAAKWFPVTGYFEVG